MTKTQNNGESQNCSSSRLIPHLSLLIEYSMLLPPSKFGWGQWFEPHPRVSPLQSKTHLASSGGYRSAVARRRQRSPLTLLSNGLHSSAATASSGCWAETYQLGSAWMLYRDACMVLRDRLLSKSGSRFP